MTHYDWLYRIARALHQTPHDTQAMIQSALSLTGTALGVERGCIVTFGAAADGAGEIEHGYLLGAELHGQAERDLWTRLIERGLLGFVQHSQRLIVIRNTRTDPRWTSIPDVPHGSAVGLPLRCNDRLYGALILNHPHIDYFDGDRLTLLEELEDLLGAALAHAALHTEQNRADRLRRDLAAMTYHDLRAPLQNILGSLSRLEKLTDSRTLPRDLIQIAQQSTRQLTRMIKSLLDIERLENDQVQIDVKPCPVFSLLSEAVDLVTPLATEAEQRIVFDVPPDLPSVALDRDMILRVVVNLLENAIKYTPARGKVTLSARLTADGLHISVADTGPGIPASARDVIFDKYIRLTQHDAPTGLGLGLAFCRLAVEAHGGKIWVTNAPGQGAVFTFVLPDTAVVPAPRPAVASV